ncbi:RAVE protein 1 C terminal-domain-containing protein [Corynascus novoguineensis]|uniref:RAVE protein 1 C terminal-domain-containing protein n=1 Tax=Corynascus novoguineensis TaxID=1126955 RepID=A0AAN7CWR8_9PEZI|nr:RAVE protein 1 C terminal-domain-containing protein [Corynascus novoguineensis]
MPDSESSLLLATAGSSKNHEPGEQDELLESTPLLSSSTTPRYDGDRDDAHPADTTSVASRNTGATSARSDKSKSTRWPSIIAMTVLGLFTLAAMVLAFIVPTALQEYAKEAVVIEPTNLSLESLTSNGIRARIQLNFRVEAQRVANEHFRRVGRAVTWVARELGAEETKIRFYLPDYNNVLLGTAGLPPLKASIVDGHNNEVDFVAELAPGDAEGIRTIANDWLKGRLNTVQIRGHADVELKSGIIPLGTHTIVESMTFEGSKLPHMPEYNITRLNFKEQPIPGASNAMAAEVTIQSFNQYPVSFDLPELGFEILVPGCSHDDLPIPAAAATTSRIAVRPRTDVIVNARGLIRDLPDPLTRLCPNSDFSPLDLLFKKYLDGEAATVLVRGQRKPTGDTPDWLAEILSSVTVPVPFPGRSFDNLIRSFSLTDVYFKLPDPAAEPDDPRSNPRVSGTILVLAGLPSEMNFTLNVTSIRADADVYYKGHKLGELNLEHWQRANSTQIPATEDNEATLEIQSRINDVPLNVTDHGVLTDVIQALLFSGREVILSVKALVNVKVQTVLGDLVVKAIPAEGNIPVKPLGKDLLGSGAPKVGTVQITHTTPISLSFQAVVNITNPTPYSARIPFASIYVESNGTTIGEAFARNIYVKPGNNTDLSVSAIWNPSMGGEKGVEIGRDFLSRYASGYSTNVTLRTHRGTIPTLPELGEALSRLNFTLPAPRIRFPGQNGDGNDNGDGGDEDEDGNDKPRFIREATFHIFSSTATFTLASPLLQETIYIDFINATALYNHTEPIGRIEYSLPFAVPPGLSVTPRLPVEWSMDSVGYDKVREALGGTLKLDGRAAVGLRLGRWTERVWYVGRGIGAGVRMRAVLPGKPESRLQALTTGCWGGRRITAYITGNALVILGAPDELLQTVYDDDTEPLQAIALDEASGKIAVCTRHVVRVYQPLGAGRVSLSWGASEELLVAHSSLELYQTSSNLPTPECSWRKKLANPIRLASLSYDSAYIASVGEHDRLVKVWRRLSYGTGEVRFDFLYLRHPQPVARIQWRRPHHVDQTIENALAPGASTPGDNTRWAFVMHGGDLAAATETAVQEGTKTNEEAAALERLITVANRSPEICVVLDGRGRISAWALENIGSKASKPSIFNVAHVTSPELDFLRGTSSSKNPHVEAYSYCHSGEHLHLLLHFFDGRIEVYRSNVAALFDRNPTRKPLTKRCLWTGHSGPIRKIVRNFSGRAVVSRTEDGQGVIWKHSPGAERTGLARQAVIPEQGHIHRMCLLRNGRFAVFLQHENISLWDCRQSTPTLLAKQRYNVSGKPLCLLVLPRQKVEDYTTAHIATVTSEKKGVVWEVKFPFYSRTNTATIPPTNGANGTEHQQPSVREFVQFTLQDADDLAYVLSVDPAGTTPHVSGFLDVFARDVAISYTHSGRVQFWTARVGHGDCGRVEWLSTSSMETGVSNPALVSGSTRKKAALVNASRSALTIWDIGGARLEFAQEFENSHTIRDLDWTSTPDMQSILAVGFPHRVLLLSQMRFDYLNGGPAWAAIREISIRDLTPHPIGDSVWLGDGHLVVGAGNQLFVQDRRFDAASSLVTSLRLPQRRAGEKHWDLFDVVQHLNGPLPVFHPQFLSQCILAGKMVLVHAILMALYRTLKFWVEGDELDDYLGLALEDFYAVDHTTKTSLNKDPGQYLQRRMSYDEGDEPFSEEVAAEINERLTRINIAQLSGHEQIQLVNIVECVGLVEKQRCSLDENGARFVLFFRQQALGKGGRTGEIRMGWREINWAFHSTSQDVLVDIASRHSQGRMLWKDARDSGIFMWLADNAAVKSQFEVIARNEYAKNDPKNPIDCSLFYLALKKKTVLQGLWRMAAWNPEQGATQRLLANNFDQPKWRTVALKNAYALMSKRRFEYAAAFFLLADHLQDAVNVCLNQLKDLQLAIAVARVYEGDTGPVLRRLLEEEVLSIAAQEGNRWLASWAFWMLHRRDMAVRALITPVYTLLETPGSLDLKSRLFLTDDPALVILYSQLRQMTLQTLRGASKVTPKVEWEFVLHNARLYDRMGCDLLGLDLVRNWEFLQPAGPAAGLGGEINPLRLLRRRESLVVADLPVIPQHEHLKQQQSVPAEMKSGGHLPKQQAPPTTFEEPDANSLLDSFGF